MTFPYITHFGPQSSFAARQMSRTAYWVFGAAVLLGCDALTSVQAPDVIQPGDYTGAAGASALAIGAITRFNETFAGSAPGLNVARNQVMQSGQIADELFAAATDLGEINWDRRDPIEPSPGSALFYDPLHGARVNLLNAIASFERMAPDSVARIGELFALVGYTEVFLGENFCSGVPLSRLDVDLRPVYGRALTTEEMFQRAIADFDSALAYGADSTRLVQLAAVGKGRALLNLGRFAEAAQAVANVPPSYVYNATFVAGTLHNGVRGGLGNQNWFTIPEREGGNGLNWRTANDPRVQLVMTRQGLDRSDVWEFVRYQSATAPITLAGGLEARLIAAEAALQAGDATTWLSIHNALRATAIAPAMPSLADPGNAAARVDLHFRERAFWLFLTGHRHGDLRRLVRQYGRGAESVFPTGVWRQGIPYGNATSIALSPSSTNNPNYVGCLTRSS